MVLLQTCSDGDQEAERCASVDRHCGWQDADGPEGRGDLDAAATRTDSSKEMSFLGLTPEVRMGDSVRSHTEASGMRLLGLQANSATDSLCDLGHDI